MAPACRPHGETDGKPTRTPYPRLSEPGQPGGGATVQAPRQRCFVPIEPLPAPGIAREERRYLNSRHSMWEYWHYRIRRIVLQAGWEVDQWHYDHYLIADDSLITTDEEMFFIALKPWLPDVALLRHSSQSYCPL
ncbi:hypothetical protein [Chitinimonas lacunae]|uniref:Uncharacterized protein n=1 Tax=Chitinimonas lacunae TaxID=1963018 RepID=A0ABV8MW84_9NEIS